MIKFTGKIGARRARHSALAMTLGLACCFAACKYDGNDRCGDDLEFDGRACICPEGAVLVGSECQMCGEHEVAGSTGCDCEEGYTRAEPTAACAPDAGSGAGGAGGESSSGPDSGGPPDGLGMSCESHADCAGTEAEFCDTFSTNTCLVKDCNVEADDCYEGFECCDLQPLGFPVLCVATGECPL